MPDLPYDRPSDPAKRHSAALTDGPDRAGARAMLKAVGFTDDDLARPLIGVATTWIETMPCNLNQRRLAEHVKAGIRSAGGTPMEFNTVSVSDGVSMGTEGMKSSLVSREVIADSIELVVRGHLLDGLVCLVGCDKTIPAAAMALGRLDVPGLVLYNGTIYPGTYKGQRNATVVTVYEAIGAYRAGKISLEELYDNLDLVAKLPVRGASKLAAKLEAHREDAFLARRLTEIACDMPLEVARANLARRAPDVPALTAFFDRHNFGPMLRRQAERLALLPLSVAA